NVSLIIDLAVYVEGFMCKILLTAIDKRKSTNEFNIRITNHIREKISNSTWSQYKESFSLVMGSNISNIVPNENLKSVNLLFEFRNILVHANDLSVNYYNTAKGEEDYDSSLSK